MNDRGNNSAIVNDKSEIDDNNNNDNNNNKDEDPATSFEQRQGVIKGDEQNW